MRKRLFFVLLIIILWPINSAQAGIKIVDTASVTIGEFTIDFYDPVQTRWAVELKDLGNEKQLGIYPSTKPVSFIITAEGDWQYRSITSSQWLDLDGIITDNKIDKDGSDEPIG